MGPSEFNTYGGRFSLASQVNPDIARQLAARPKKVRPPKPTTVPASEYVGDVVPIDVDAALTHVEQFAPEFKLLRSFIVKNQAGSVFMHPEISAEVFAKKKFGRQLRVYNKSLGGKMMRGAEKVWYDAWEANGWATRATKYVNVFVSEKNRGASFMKKWDFEDLRKGVRHHMELAGKVPQRIYSVSTIGSWATEFNQAKTFCTWTHEMSHRVFFKLFMSNGAKPSRLYQQAARVAEKYKGRGITTYSDTNVDEFYAEHIAAWLIDRKGMEKAFPEIADIVKDIMAWAK
jgi:hypothetical protein